MIIIDCQLYQQSDTEAAHRQEKETLQLISGRGKTLQELNESEAVMELWLPQDETVAVVGAEYKYRLR